MGMTWSSKVAMSKKEIDKFLDGRHVARAATLRSDGSIHITPLWYIWDGNHLWLELGHGARPRQHITNLRRDPRISIIIDRDIRPETRSLKHGAQAVLIRGTAELSDEEKLQREKTTKLAVRYLGPPAKKLVEGFLQDGKPGMNRVIAKIKPDKIIAWDFRKL